MDFDDNINKLNDDWITEFEHTDSLYKDFYKETLCSINLQIVYINNQNEISNVKSEPYIFTHLNILSSLDIKNIINKFELNNKIPYSLFSILKYNITLEPTEINRYLISEPVSTYLSHIDSITGTTLNNIIFNKSIHMFQDLNCVILIFKQI